MASVKLVMIVSLAVMMMFAPMAARAAITCGDVVRELTPCVGYLQSGGQVPGNCCNGIRTLYNAAQTTPDRQAVCQCLESAVSNFRYSSYNLGLAQSLPAKCNVNIPYKIDPSTNCKNVK
ncbi:hypothetical protein JCGZ_00661 [Jatropha curcas]|uniref:Non-specific lipid-transfer protein n=1 Tax=Jatropha curcas TaxID=180498 RepID=A0A067JQQ4_JATCU|nr:non-specific lipid-transfer protein 1 [Jatropha curcas]KDP21874.1 hypothetical protein JCGZ_00661 [Jatropha curcas]